MSGNSEYSYDLRTDGPSAWTWDQYEEFLSSEWALCLTNALDEKTVQQFLEKHPCLVPGGQGGQESNAGHHGAFYEALITQPRLDGEFNRQPDFMWLTRHSGAVIPVIIEIENPNKPWYTRAGQETAPLTQARTQLTEWQTWLDTPGNEIVFRSRYELEGKYSESRAFEPLFWLIYGRSAETHSKPLANRGRSRSDRNGTESMTFDRLAPNHGSRNSVTIRHSSDRKSTVLHIPPTFQLGPSFAHHLDVCSGWDQAIERNEQLSPERKQFLIERIPYWIDWHNSPTTSAYSSSDVE